MRKVLTITKLHLKMMFKTPAGIVLMFVMPLVFSAIFGGMAGGDSTNKPLVLVVADKSELSRQTVQLLKENTQYKWQETTEKKAKEMVKEQDAIAAVLVNKDISMQIKNKLPLFEVVNLRETQEYITLHSYLESAAGTIIQSYQFAANIDVEKFPELLSNVNEREGVKVEKEIIQKDGDQKENVSLMTIGFTIMFMMFGISGASSTILDERKAGTWQRLLTTPATKGQILAGYLLSYFLMAWVQLLVLMVAMTLIFDAVWGNLAYFIPFASLIILTVVGFGMMIAGLVKTSQQAGALSAVVIVSTCMLGGLYWPIEIVPEVMQKIALGVPQSWMMDGLREIISGSLHTPTLIQSTLVLLGFCVIFFSIGLKKIKFY